MEDNNLKWKVLKEYHVTKKVKYKIKGEEKFSNASFIFCEVECPVCKKIFERSKINVKKTFMCHTCRVLKYNRSRRYHGYKTIGELSGTFVNEIQRRGKVRNIPFNVSVEYLWNLFLKQDRKCALSNLPINVGPYSKWNFEEHKKLTSFSKISASLDRIDSSKGYVENNVQWVHKIINVMKNTLSNEEFAYFCKKVANNFKEDNTELNLNIGEVSKMFRRVQRLTSEDSTNNLDTSTPQPDVKQVEDIV